MVNRDGYCKSVWQDSVAAYNIINKDEPESVYDVLIVGGGITGVTTGLLLQQAGLHCMIAEANSLGFGTTGGTTAHINTILDVPYTTIEKNFGKENAKRVAQSVMDAIEFIRKNINTWQIECGFEEASAYLFAQNSDQEKELNDIIQSTQEAGVSIAYASSIPVSIPFTKAAIIPGQAKFSPLEYIYALAKAFEEAGGVIAENCRVMGVEESETLSVKTNAGSYRAKHMIYATHILPGVNLLHMRCVPYRSYAMAVTLKEEAYPDDLIYDMYDPYHYYRTQIVNGKRYLIVGGEDHKTAHEVNTDKSFLQLERHIRQYFRVDTIKYKWSSQYYESVDGLPYIGHLPGAAKNIYVATGFGGNGMVYSGVAALTLKAILLNEPLQYADLYTPGRIKPVAGFTEFITHNADTVKQFLGKLFSGEELVSLSGLANGEGKLVEYENKKIALYKDEKGNLHALNPVCTHMQCEVKWNSAERSWDCPCHGARYSVDGEVLTGPADRDMEQVNVQSNIKV